MTTTNTGSTDSSGSRPKEVFQSGDAYEPYVGRWSRLVAREFLAWLAIPTSADWLDVGCGTGALTETILAATQPRSVTAIDPSAGFVDHARAQIRDSRARFEIGDARSLPFEAGSIDAAVGGLMLNFVPDPNQAVREMARVTCTGGTVATYVWDYADKMEFMRHFWDAAVTLDPAAEELDEGRRFSLCQPEPLTALWTSVGLRDVTTTAIDIPTVFRDFDDFWLPFLGGQGSAPGYLKTLDADRQAALREEIRAGLPIDADGSIHLIARAWAVRGRR